MTSARLAILVFVGFVAAFPIFGDAPEHADLSLDVWVPTRVSAIEPVDFYVRVTNEGPDRATDVRIRLETTTGATIRPNAGCVSTDDGCRLSELKAGSETELVFRLTNEPRAQDVDLEFSVVAQQDDPDPTNNRLRTRTTLVAAPALRFQLWGNSADPAGLTEYTAWILNTGTQEATDLRFTLPLPEGWTFERTTQGTLSCTQSGTEVHCSVPSLAGRTTITPRFLLRAGPSEAGLVYTSTPVPLTSSQGVFEPREATAHLSLSAFQWFKVTTTADDGAGSLRDAITRMNAECSGYPHPPCKIAFAIEEAAPADHHVLEPLTPLPAITVWGVVDGSTQTTRIGDTNPLGPEIVLHGSRLASGHGLEIEAQGVTVKDLVVNGFPGDGIRITKTGYFRAIENCYIGTDATGRIAVPNALRGIAIDIADPYSGTTVLRNNVISGNLRSGVFAAAGNGIALMSNRIGISAGNDPVPLGNGASGVYYGAATSGGSLQANVIAYNQHAGIAMDRNARWVAIHANTIFANGGLGIDYGLDGTTPNATSAPEIYRELPNYPTITAAQFDAASGTTTIEGKVDGTWRPYVANVELFANDTADAEAQVYLGRVPLDPNLRFSLSVSQDLRGRFLTATYTVPNNYYPEVLALKTSELSPAFRVDGEATAPIDPKETLPRGADLAISIGGYAYTGVEVAAGSERNLSLNLSNAGPLAAEDVNVELSLSRGSWIVTSGNCVVDGLLLRCHYPRLDANASISSEVVLVSAPMEPGPQRIEASVTSATEDRYPTNNRADSEVEVTAKTMVQASVEWPRWVDPGEVAPWAIALSVLSASPATDVAVTIDIPHGWTLESGPTSGWQCRQDTAQPAIVCTIARLEGNSTTRIEYALRAPSTPDGSSTYGRNLSVTTAQGVFNDPYTFYSYNVNRILTVTTTADLGPGSLRSTIETVNQQCSNYAPHCKIVFALPAELAENGVFSIRPATPLPTITGENTLIDGRTQTRFGGDTNPSGPEIELHGGRLSAGNGLAFSGSGESGVRGFVINGFPENGIVIDLPTAVEYGTSRILADNYIGTSADGQRAVPNGSRGIVIHSGSILRTSIVSNVISGNARSGLFLGTGSYLRITGNRIGLTSGANPSPLGNGASGLYLGEVEGTRIAGNSIAFNRDAGISIASAAEWNGITGNSIHDNGQLGIDHNLDGATRNDDPARTSGLPPYPELFSAVWDDSAKVTRVTGSVPVDWAGGSVELFESAAADPSGLGEGQRSLGTIVLLTGTGPEPFSFSIPQDLRGRFVTATFSRGWDTRGTIWTSEFSAALRVP